MTFDHWLYEYQQPLLSLYLKQLREQCEDEAAFKTQLREICRIEAVASARSLEAQERAMLMAVASILGASPELAWKSGWTPAKVAPSPETDPAHPRTVATGRHQSSLVAVPLAPQVPPAGAVAPAPRTADEWALLLPSALLEAPEVDRFQDPPPRQQAWAAARAWPHIPTLWPLPDGPKHRRLLTYALRACRARVSTIMLERNRALRPPTLLELWKEHGALTQQTYDLLRLAQAILQLLELPRQR